MNNRSIGAYWMIVLYFTDDDWANMLQKLNLLDIQIVGNWNALGVPGEKQTLIIMGNMQKQNSCDDI